MLAGSVLAADAPAKNTGPKPDANSFEALDKNRDGKLTQDEARTNAGLAKLFKGLDSNKDGALSQEEFIAYAPSEASKS